VLLDGDGVAYVAATAGAPPGPAPSVADLAVLLAALAPREALTTPPLGVSAWASPGGAWVALPVPIDAALAGAVVLSVVGPRSIAPEERLLWRAMAVQVGVALGSARLFARLQEALRARGEFVDTMSHELRSPLHVILGYADMLAEQRVDVGFAAGRIRASSLELLQLVENTMTAARFGSGKMSVQVSEFELSALLDEVRETAAALPYANGDVALLWEIAPDLPPVRLDRLKVKEIVHNLAANALKFTARGSVTVRAARDGEMVRLEVEDTGSGIPDDEQARIFEMFERFEPAGAARPAGAGLGLYIVRSLVGLMSGTVAVYSVSGHGARFTVRLPIRLAAG
jgi:signal transduction histidine kinase